MMIRLERSEALKTRIRKDDVVDLAIPTWTLVREAIQAGRIDEALDFIDYAISETRESIDSRSATIDMAATRIASLGEEELEKFWRQRYEPRVVDFLSTKPSVEESLQRITKMFRGLFADFTITEEEDKYVVRQDRCSTGGMLRRSRSVATTKHAHPWSWGRSGVCIYCTHCCLIWEILPIELRGYPVKIALYNDNPHEPCVQLFYKKPEFIPEDYFRKLGMPPYKGG